MRQLTIDPEFRDKIPPLSSDEFAKLEENILADGEVREPLVVWHNTIIDGHHRWAIIQKHSLTNYKVKQMDFPDKWAAIVWMCRNQLGRRNVTQAQRDYLLKEEHDALVKTHGAADGFRGNQYVKVVNGQNGQLPNQPGEMFQARKAVSKEHGIKESEVRRAVEFGRGLDEAERVSPGIRDSVLSGEVKAPKSVISEIRNMPEEHRPAVVDAIKQGKISDAKEIIKASKPVPKKEPEPEPAPFTPKQLRELIDAAAKNLGAALKQHLVLVHRDVLDTADGRSEAVKGIQNVISVAEKYLDMIRRIEENVENN